ncbi:metal ABC transporter substrate-binding protein [Verminephrobacter eiseniae]|uniref:metal ABC transporter solute-binding protein, Zn/Mn family n=1 Tax=Verminephrobacter eiseniae TaxID=364317 RepID=UPI002A530E25|nr:metal ABC transporter substrate-binding protein [Verminephrobacter eiseniae]
MIPRPFLKNSRRALLLMALAVSSPGWAAEPGLNVVASFSILADIARAVGGPDVSVTALVGPDGDAHMFEPTPQHARTLQRASVLVSNGLGFEGWMVRLKKSAGFKGLELIASEGVKVRTFDASAQAHDSGGKGDRHHHAPRDPHAWQNVANAVIYANNIAKGFAKKDPAHAAAYRARAAAYSERLLALDAQIRRTFAALPPERRVLVTTHDAFGYYAQAYGLRIVPARGFSTQAEPSASDIARLVDQVRAQRIPAMFIENISDPRLVEQLARETGATVGGKLYSDALSPPDGPAATYLLLMQGNTATLASALAAAAQRTP